MIEKNTNLDVTIVDMTNDGEGIGKVDGFPFFIKGAVTGDRVKIVVTKLKKNYGYGKVLKIIKKSKDRVEPKCRIASQCGGCTLQHLSYEAQLEFKQNKVMNCLKRIGGIENVEALMSPIIGMDEPFRYRNKAQFPVGTDEHGNIIYGFYAGRSHRIMACEDCYLQRSVNAEIMSAVKEWMDEYHIPAYDEELHEGLVRHVLTRVCFSTGEIMVCLIINGDDLPFADELVEVLSGIEGMSSICINVNKEQTNRILGDDVKVLWGNATVTDYIGDVKYSIGPKSFYQVNPVQTKVLYEKALEYADLSCNETVWDLYCGIGTISLFLAQKAKHVYGVEIVKEAIDDAIINARLNGFDNTTFYVGKAEEVLPAWVKEQESKGADGKNDVVSGLHPDVIVVDPPRKGCDEKCLETMVYMSPKRIVYVSCDPATLARDVKWLSENGYELVKVQPVDQFPQTGHVESVSLLSRTEGTTREA